MLSRLTSGPASITHGRGAGSISRSACPVKTAIVAAPAAQRSEGTWGANTSRAVNPVVVPSNPYISTLWVSVVTSTPSAAPSIPHRLNAATVTTSSSDRHELTPHLRPDLSDRLYGCAGKSVQHFRHRRDAEDLERRHRRQPLVRQTESEKAAGPRLSSVGSAG